MKRYSLLIGLLTVITLMLVGVSSVNAAEKNGIPKGYTPIYSIEDLFGINGDLEGKYILMNDIDMSETEEGGDWDFGYGWRPIGYSSENQHGPDYFNGVFDGNGYRIYNMHIFGDAPYRYIGLFAYCIDEGVKNLALEDFDINLYISEENDNNSYADSFYDQVYIGSICGWGEIEDCYSIGSINFGFHSEDEEYDETEDYRWQYINIGSLMGRGIATDCYSNVSITSYKCGGIVGDLNLDSKNAYAIGNINAQKGNPIRNGERYLNGMYYLKTIGSESAATGLSKAQMKLQKCFVDFDFDKIWFIDKNSPYPYPQLKACPQVRTESISIETEPDKTVYGIDDELDLTGATLSIQYEDNEEVTIPIDESMCTYSMKKGKQTVVVSYNGCTDSFDINVGEDGESLTITSQATVLSIGDSFKFKAKYTGDEAIKFSSSNPKVLKINSKTGKASAKKAGKVTITVKAGKLVEEFVVKVVK